MPPCIASSRSFLLLLRARLFRPADLRVVRRILSKCYLGDWWVLYQIGRNSNTHFFRYRATGTLRRNLRDDDFWSARVRYFLSYLESCLSRERAGSGGGSGGGGGGGKGRRRRRRVRYRSHRGSFKAAEAEAEAEEACHQEEDGGDDEGEEEEEEEEDLEGGRSRHSSQQSGNGQVCIEINVVRVQSIFD